MSDLMQNTILISFAIATCLDMLILLCAIVTAELSLYSRANDVLVQAFIGMTCAILASAALVVIGLGIHDLIALWGGK